MYLSRSLTSRLRSSISATAASHSSPRLWGGMLVAMPTAMPAQPLASSCGSLAGSTIGSSMRAVVVGPEVDRALVDLVEQLHGQLLQPGLGVAHGRRGVAVERAEVAVALDQRVAEREVLGHAHQGVVGGGVPVRVVLAQHVPDDGRALAEARVGVEVQVVVHGVQDPPLHRLEPVAHVGQGPGRDDADRVVEVAALGLIHEVGVRRVRTDHRRRRRRRHRTRPLPPPPLCRVGKEESSCFDAMEYKKTRTKAA